MDTPNLFGETFPGLLVDPVAYSEDMESRRIINKTAQQQYDEAQIKAAERQKYMDAMQQIQSAYQSTGTVPDQSLVSAQLSNPAYYDQLKKLQNDLPLNQQRQVALQSLHLIGAIDSGNLEVAAKLADENAKANESVDPTGSKQMAGYAAALRSGDVEKIKAARQGLYAVIQTNPSDIATTYVNSQLSSAKAQAEILAKTAEARKTNLEYNRSAMDVAVQQATPAISTAVDALSRGDRASAVQALNSVNLDSLPTARGVLAALNTPSQQQVTDNQTLINQLNSAIVPYAPAREAIKSGGEARVLSREATEAREVADAVSSGNISSVAQKYPNNPTVKSTIDQNVQNASKILATRIPEITPLIVSGDTKKLSQILGPLANTGNSATDNLFRTVSTGRTYQERFQALDALHKVLGIRPEQSTGKPTLEMLTTMTDEREQTQRIVDKIAPALRVLETEPEGFGTHSAYNYIVNNVIRPVLGSDVSVKETIAAIEGSKFKTVAKEIEPLRPATDTDVAIVKGSLGLENASAEQIIKYLQDYAYLGTAKDEYLRLKDQWLTKNGGLGPNTSIATIRLLDREYAIPYGMSYDQFVSEVLNKKNSEFQHDLAKTVDDKLGIEHYVPKLPEKPDVSPYTNPAVINEPVPEKTSAAYGVTSAVAQAASQVGVRPELVAAIGKVESNQNPNAVSVAGARGTYQFVPSTREAIKAKYSVDAWSHNPVEQALAASYLLKDLTVEYGGDEARAVRAYLLGQTAVPKTGDVHNVDPSTLSSGQRREWPNADAYVNKVMINSNRRTGREEPLRILTDKAPQAQDLVSQLQPWLESIPKAFLPREAKAETLENGNTPTSTGQKKGAVSPIAKKVSLFNSMVYGEGRTSEEVANAKDFYDIPELRPLGMAFKGKGADSVQALLSTMSTSPKETARIMTSMFPNIYQVPGKETDKYGNQIFHRKDDPNIYAIKPGLQFSDIAKAIIVGTGYTAATAGVVAAGASPIGGALLAGAALSGAGEALQSMSGGEFNPGSIATDAGVNALFPVLGKLARGKGYQGRMNIPEERQGGSYGTTVMGAAESPKELAPIIAGTEADTNAANRVLQAEHTLGVTQQTPVQVLAQNPQAQSVAQIVAPKPQSKMVMADYKEGLKTRAGALIDELTGGLDRGSVSDSVRQSIVDTTRDLRDLEKKSYEVLFRVVPPETPANTRVLQQKIADELRLRGNDQNQLSQIGKDMIDLVNSNPTLYTLKEKKSEIQRMARDRSSVYATQGEATVNAYANALRESEAETVGQFGPEATAIFEQAKDTSRIEHGLQEKIVDLFGREMTGSINSRVASGVSEANRTQNTSKLQKLLDIYGDTVFGEGGHAARYGVSGAGEGPEIRKKIMGSILQDLFANPNQGHNLDLQRFVNYYGSAQGNQNLKTFLADNLSPEVIHRLDALHLLSKTILDSERQVVRTGQHLGLEASLNRQDTAGAQATRFFKGLGLWGPLTAALKMTGIPFIGEAGAVVGTLISQSLLKPRELGSDVLDRMFTNPTFITALKDSIKNPSGLTEAQYARLSNTPTIRDAITYLRRVNENLSTLQAGTEAGYGSAVMSGVTGRENDAKPPISRKR